MSRYRAYDLIGSGGYGDVYLGAMMVGREASRRVAIKRLFELAEADPAAVQRFTDEAKLLACLHHPNIVSMIDYQVDSAGRHCLIMDYVDGCNLARCLAHGACPPSVAVHVITEVLRALGYLHRMPAEAGVRGFVHRDVSPQNILLSWSGTALLSDFGISKVMDTMGAKSQTIRGRATYSSPEHINNEVVDGRSDLFSVGVVLWEMLAGRKLFHGESPGIVFARVLFAAIPSLIETASISPALEAVVMRLLERKADKRYASAEEVISDLLTCPEWPRNGRDELASLVATRFERQPRVLLHHEERLAQPGRDRIVELGAMDFSRTEEREISRPPLRHLRSARWRSRIDWIAQWTARRRGYALAATTAALLLLTWAFVFSSHGDDQKTMNNGPSVVVTPVTMPPLAAPPPGELASQETGRSQASADQALPVSKPSPRSTSSRRAPQSGKSRALPAQQPGEVDTSRYPETMRHILGAGPPSS